MSGEVLLTATNIIKNFGPTKALAGVSMQVKRGEIHGLIGENGSGKSTLASIIAGAQGCDEGVFEYKGREYISNGIQNAIKQGICMIVQEQGTLNGLSVAANVFLGQEAQFCKAKILDTKRMNEETKKALALIDSSNIVPTSNINKLSFEDRKLIEIGRAMYTNPEILIVDETTTALPSRGREILYSIMKKMRDSGKAVLFITHDIDEILQLCDVVTILRDGNVTGTLTKSEMEVGYMKRLMVGRDVKENFYRVDYDGSYSNDVTLEFKGVSAKIIKNIDLKLHKGEILGIGGLTDCGMHELGKVAYGRILPTEGHVEANGVRINSVKAALNKNIGYLAKDRDQEALMLVGSIEENICLPSLNKIAKKGFLTQQSERKFIKEWVEKLSIKMNSTSQYCMYLSGGNKQKVSLAKWLANDSEILILDCPTRGIDVGVKSDIYKLITELKKLGKSIILISEELPELIGMSDRIVTMKNGCITGEYMRSEHLTEHTVIESII